MVVTFSRHSIEPKYSAVTKSHYRWILTNRNLWLSVRLAEWFQVIERAAGPTGTSFSLQEKALSASLENPCPTESQLRLGSKYGDRSLGVRSLQACAVAVYCESVK